MVPLRRAAGLAGVELEARVGERGSGCGETTRPSHDSAEIWHGACTLNNNKNMVTHVIPSEGEPGSDATDRSASTHRCNHRNHRGVGPQKAITSRRSPHEGSPNTLYAVVVNGYFIVHGMYAYVSLRLDSVCPKWRFEWREGNQGRENLVD